MVTRKRLKVKVKVQGSYPFGAREVQAERLYGVPGTGYLIISVFLFRSRFFRSQNAANEIHCTLHGILIEFMFVVNLSNPKLI